VDPFEDNELKDAAELDQRQSTPWKGVQPMGSIELVHPMDTIDEAEAGCKAELEELMPQKEVVLM